MDKTHVQVKVTNDSDNELPKYESAGAAGVDLRANILSAVILSPNTRILVKTGLKVAIPGGYEIQIRSRSGLAYKHGVVVLNAPGTIDSDYRGDIGVILLNTGGESLTIEPGMKIAQAVLAKVETLAWDEVVMLPKTDRGEGGFGSTDEKKEKVDDKAIQALGKLPYKAVSLLPYLEKVDVKPLKEFVSTAIEVYEGEKRDDLEGSVCCLGTTREFSQDNPKDKQIEHGLHWLAFTFVERVKGGHIKKAMTDVHLIDVGEGRVSLVMGISSDFSKEELLLLEEKVQVNHGKIS